MPSGGPPQSDRIHSIAPRVPESVVALWFPWFRGSLITRYMDALHAARQGLGGAEADAVVFRGSFFPKPEDAYRRTRRYLDWCAALEAAGFRPPRDEREELELLVRWGLFRRRADGSLEVCEDPPAPAEVFGAGGVAPAAASWYPG